MKQSEKTQQFDFSFEKHGYGACAAAAKQIAEGKTVKFDLFTRGNNCTEMIFKSTYFFGKAELEPGCIALRQSVTSDLIADGTSSLIPSHCKAFMHDPVFIAARLVQFLMREGSDWFINTESD